MGNEEEEKFSNQLEIVEYENPKLLFEQQANLKKWIKHAPMRVGVSPYFLG